VGKCVTEDSAGNDNVTWHFDVLGVPVFHSSNVCLRCLLHLFPLASHSPSRQHTEPSRDDTIQIFAPPSINLRRQTTDRRLQNTDNTNGRLELHFNRKMNSIAAITLHVVE
jgi:hypothetical protein